MPIAKQLHSFNHFCHGLGAVVINSRTEKKAGDMIALVELEEQVGHFLGGESGSGEIEAASILAVVAVVLAAIGHQDLEQRDAATPRKRSLIDPSGQSTRPRFPSIPALGIAPGRLAAPIILGSRS